MGRVCDAPYPCVSFMFSSRINGNVSFTGLGWTIYILAPMATITDHKRHRIFDNTRVAAGRFD